VSALGKSMGSLASLRGYTTKELEDDYIKNLQEQIHLLEVETRYLKDQKQTNVTSAPAKPTNFEETISTLKEKYQDLQKEKEARFKVRQKGVIKKGSTKE
jgi:tRNA splicing endonuclease